jgi:RNA polymerase sigma-70 factor (ECF subfamily)
MTEEAAADRVTADASDLQFRAWVEPHLAVMRRVAAREVGSAGADDVVQEALVRAWRRRETFDPSRGAPRTWLLAIVLDRARRHARDAARWPRLHLVDTHDDDAQPVSGSAVGQRLDVEAAVRRLAARQRQAVVLHYLADLSVEDIALVLGISVGSVKTHLRQARARLRTHLENS